MAREPEDMMYAALKAGLAYFALVFGAGFLLGNSHDRPGTETR